MKKVKITQVRSGIGRPQDQKDTLRSLGLRKMNQSVEVDMENPSMAGMVNKIKHLLKIEEI
ncbi:MAG: 50S ribosomal protein L30 [Bacteroidales bacterium]|jgi:large subunit ribosomal protein L30|nr:50S ribosomal protein L30 [Bacteroidales bacterium]MCR5040193.1 50S ribosomal protein L30 [Bacteroidales bacterium]